MKNYILLLRPRQWIKNLFVLVGILFAGKFFDASLLIDALILTASFTLAAGSVYVINDIVDVDADRMHPKKKERPIASGAISVSNAYLLLFATIILSMVLALSVSIAPTFIILSYIIMNVFYTFYLKYIPILDVFVISTGFIMRVLVGTFGIGIMPSNWLILCTFMLTLFLGFSKRRAELILTGDSNAARNVLKYYKRAFLDHAMTVTVGGTLISYALYTMSPETILRHGTENLLYTIFPVTYALFRYYYIVESEITKDDAATSLTTDRSLQVAIIVWLITFFAIKIL